MRSAGEKGGCVLHVHIRIRKKAYGFPMQRSMISSQRELAKVPQPRYNVPPIVNPAIILDVKENVISVSAANMDNLVEFSRTNEYLRYFRDTVLKKMMPNGMDMTFKSHGETYGPDPWMLRNVINNTWRQIIPQLLDNGTTVGVALVTYYRSDDIQGQVMPFVIHPSYFEYGYTMGPNGEFNYCIKARRKLLEIRTAALKQSANKDEAANAEKIASSWIRPTTISCPVLQASRIAVKTLARHFGASEKELSTLDGFRKFHVRKSNNARAGGNASSINSYTPMATAGTAESQKNASHNESGLPHVPEAKLSNPPSGPSGAVGADASAAKTDANISVDVDMTTQPNIVARAVTPESTNIDQVADDVFADESAALKQRYNITSEEATAVWPLNWINAFDLILFNEPVPTDMQMSLCGSITCALMPLLLRIDELVKIYNQMAADKVNRAIVFEKIPPAFDKTAAAHLLGPYETGFGPSRGFAQTISTVGARQPTTPSDAQFAAMTASMQYGAFNGAAASAAGPVASSWNPSQTAEVVYGTNPVQVSPESMLNAEGFANSVSHTITNSSIHTAAQRMCMTATRFWDTRAGIVFHDSPMNAVQRLGLVLSDNVRMSPVVPPDPPAGVIDHLRNLIATALATLGVPSGPMLGDKNARIANEALVDEMFTNTVSEYQHKIVTMLERIYLRTDGAEHLCTEWNMACAELGSSMDVVKIARLVSNSMAAIDIDIRFTPSKLSYDQALVLEKDGITTHALTISTAVKTFGLLQDDILWEIPIGVSAAAPVVQDGKQPDGQLSREANATSGASGTSGTSGASGASVTSTASGTKTAAKGKLGPASTTSTTGFSAAYEGSGGGLGSSTAGNTAMAYYDVMARTVTMNPYTFSRLGIPTPEEAGSSFVGSNGQMNWIRIPTAMSQNAGGSDGGAAGGPSVKKLKVDHAEELADDDANVPKDE